MREFFTRDWYNVTGRGYIAVVRIDPHKPLPTGLVKINNKIFKILGCECTRGLQRSPMVGLIVKKVEQQHEL